MVELRQKREEQKRGEWDTKVLKKGGASWTKGWVPLKGGVVEPPYELCLKHSLKSFFSSVILRK